MTTIVPPRAVVIGSGRSGTGFMAAVLTAAGLDAGHEAFWHAHGGLHASQLDVDCSWLALPAIEFGNHPEPWTGRTLHVVRHPVDTVRSLLGTALFDPAMTGNTYAAHAWMHSPRAGVLVGHNALHAAVEFWCDWNARCAAVADATVRLEDATDDTVPVSGAGVAWAMNVADVIGMGLTGQAIMKAVADTPRDTNTRGPVPEVDPLEVWGLIGRRAHAYGYGA
jgi:hypothetical protein